MLKADFERKILHFKETAITSRAHMNEKETFIVHVWDDAKPELKGVGECALFRGLSAEDTPDFERLLSLCCENPAEEHPMSSARFGFESAMADLRNGGTGVHVDTPFTRGETSIPINGLIWMGDRDTMKRRIREKLELGFRCIKLKIGGIDFVDELDLLKFIRREYSRDVIELRVDANGAFSAEDAAYKLDCLGKLELHSIEQPVKPGQWELLARLCETSPVPVALDEELIGITADADKERLLNAVKPAYIILKPSLCGGFAQADRWINLAQARGIGWWATSALESNIGLSAIAQWVSTYNPVMPQGLGTGALFTENYPSPLSLSGDNMTFNPEFKNV